MYVWRAVLGLLAATAVLPVGSAQEILRPDASGGGLHIGYGDMAVLAAGESRDDLPCTIEELDPNLEYDLTYQAGYVAQVPLKELAGGGNSLRMLFRIQPIGVETEPTYFQKRYDVPSIDEDAGGSASLPGKFRLGPGRYRVDWLMRDRAERVCARSWEIKAETVDLIEPLAASPTESSVSEMSEEIFHEEPPTRRNRGKLMHVKVLVSFTPLRAGQPNLSEYDQRSVVSMLRAIAREPSIGSFSLVAFNAHSEQILYDEINLTRINFPELGEALEESNGGLVSLEQLKDEGSGERFLREMFEAHLKGGPDEPDAYIFLGPKVVFEKNPSKSFLAPSLRPSAPVFHLIYNRNPRSYPWKGAISIGLDGFNLQEYDILRPKDFGSALRKLLDRLAAARHDS